MLPYQHDPAVVIHDLEQLGTALRGARRALSITQIDAALLSNVSPRLWNETELGKRRHVGLETLLRMMNTVGLDLVVSSRHNTPSHTGHDT